MRNWGVATLEAVIVFKKICCSVSTRSDRRLTEGIQQESAFQLLHRLKSSIANALSRHARQESGSARRIRVLPVEEWIITL